MTEKDMAEVLGVSKMTLAKHRKANLEQEVHWTVKSGHPVVYTDAGVVQVKQNYGLEDKPEEPKQQEGTVVGLPRNPSLVQVELEGRTVLCRVRARHLFVKGMKIPMMPKLTVDGSEMYQVMGQPRRRGKWN